MASSASEKNPPLTGHSPDRERPLGAYATLTGTFILACGSFAAWFRRSGRRLPEQISTGDLVLSAVATHKLSRLIAKDRVTSAVRAPFTRLENDAGMGEVDEAARGRGLRRAVGELLVCPFCLGLWIASGFTAGLLVAPRPTRWVGFAIAVEAGSDALQLAYVKAESSV